jgi:hypothetical protein
MVHTVNLPVDSITHVINIDDPNVLVPIENVIDIFKKDSNKVVRSMYTIPTVVDKKIDYMSDVYYITQVTKEEVKNTNSIKYFKIHVKYFPSEKEFDLILPSYVKLFSRTAKTFVPVEFARKSDILIDYTGNIVQILSNEPVEDYKPTEYYSIQLSNNNENPITFYLNGIFCNVYYNNFDIKDEELVEEK